MAYYAHTTNLRDSSGFDSGKNADTSANISVIYAAFGAANEDGVKLLKVPQLMAATIKTKAEQLDNPAWRENPRTTLRLTGARIWKISSTPCWRRRGFPTLRHGCGRQSANNSGRRRYLPGPVFPACLKRSGPKFTPRAPCVVRVSPRLFTDRFGNLREDTSRDQRLDDNDKAVIFTDDGRANSMMSLPTAL